MTTASMAPGLPTPAIPNHRLSSRASFLACILLSFLLRWYASAGHCDLVSCLNAPQGSPVYDDDGEDCRPYEDGGPSAAYGHKWSLDCGGVRNVFRRPKSLSFLFMLASFLVGGDDCQGSPLINTAHPRSESHNPLGELLGGTKVSCFQVDDHVDGDEGLSFGQENCPCDYISYSKRPAISDASMHEPNSLDFLSDGTSKQSKSRFTDDSLSSYVNINPPFLDWGITHLYFPSKILLTVSNVHNESILHIYRPFSTDTQYYVYEFKQLSLAPGKTTSINFVFLPRLLGSSSAHLVLQTSFGGFIVNAKGTAVDSPYRIQSLMGFDGATDGRMSKSLSMYNPSNDILYIDEVSLLVSFFYGNRSYMTSIVCRRDMSNQPSNQPTDDFNVLSNSNIWFPMEHNKFGPSFVGVRPHKLLELHPHETEHIVDINLFTDKERYFSGAICMKFRCTLHGEQNSIVVPLEAAIRDMRGVRASGKSVSVFLEPVLPCQSGKPLFSIFVINSASYLLSLVKVVEATDTTKLFEVKYVEGLLLYPVTVTHVALVFYSSYSTSTELSSFMSSITLNCKVTIVTNDSVSPQIEIPCKDIVERCLREKIASDLLTSDVFPYTSFKFQQEQTDARTILLENGGEKSSFLKLKFTERKEVDELILGNWRSQGSMPNMSIIEDHEVHFPLVQVGNQHSKWIRVRNVSPKPIIVQLVLNSAVIVDQCKSDALSEQSLLTISVHMHSTENMYGFSIADIATVEAFVYPFGTAEIGPIVFHPSRRCMWRSSALIRNNLSGVEWLSLRGMGGFQSLTLLDDSKPVKKLLFDLDLQRNFNASSKEFKEGASCACLVAKELYAKNAGEFPLEVIKLDITGTSHGINGFVVHNSKGFTLEPGESTRLLISFQPDFSSAVIHRDLEFVLPTGILVIPMKASLSTTMLKLCRKTIPWTQSKKLFLLLVTLMTLLLLCSFSHVYSIVSGNLFFKKNKDTTSVCSIREISCLHHNTQHHSAFYEDNMPEVIAISRYPDCRRGIQDNCMKSQGKQFFGHQGKKLLSSSSSMTMRTEKDVVSCSTAEKAQTDNLSIRVIKEKSRRKKRRAGGAGTALAAKLEVSSSQSGNSTPSSPLSPGDCTPRQVWPSSPQAFDHSFSGKAEPNHGNADISPNSPKVHVTDLLVNCGSSAKFPACDSPLPVKHSVRPLLLPSASFPGAGRRTPGAAGVASVSSSSTPLALHARAPGSKLGMEKSAMTDEGSAFGEEFVYNIWGNHFCDRLLQRTMESRLAKTDASEGDSQSFFAMDPQTLMTMLSSEPASPTPERSYDVKYAL